METKELKISVPDGYEIDKENSTFEKIIFKKKEEPKTYEEVAALLFRGKDGFYIDYLGRINEEVVKVDVTTLRPNTALTKEQLKWILALNKLQNVANYLNDGWVPDWSDLKQEKYSLYFDGQKITGDHSSYVIRSAVYFKNRELALKAIEILGEEVIKTALGVYKGC